MKQASAVTGCDSGGHGAAQWDEADECNALICTHEQFPKSSANPCFAPKTMKSPSVPESSKRSALYPIRTFTEGIETSLDKNRLTYCALTVASGEPGYQVNNLQPSAAIKKFPIESPWIYHEL